MPSICPVLIDFSGAVVAVLGFLLQQSKGNALITMLISQLYYLHELRIKELQTVNTITLLRHCQSAEAEARQENKRSM